MTHNTKLNRHLLLATAILTVTVFIAGCSSTTNLSSSDAKIKGLKFVNANPEKITPVKRQANDAVVASSPTRSFTTPSELAQPTITTASSNNEVVMASVAQNKIATPAVQLNNVIVAPQNVQSAAKVAETKATETKVKGTKPKGSKTKLFLLGLMAYITLGSAVFTAKHLKDTKKAGGGGCKSWIACLLLCWLVGTLGIHRFYMGYTWQGIVQLLTAGGCGVWTLIDFIRIIMKTLQPKDGDYC